MANVRKLRVSVQRQTKSQRRRSSFGRTTTRSQMRLYFRDWIDTAFRNGLITRHSREQALAAMAGHLPAIVAALNKRGKASLKLGARSLNFFLREGLDPSQGKFNLFEIQWQGRPKPERLSCFLGHRVLKSISNSLRLNLRHVLEPFNIRLDWAGMDMVAVGFFDDIVAKIQTCDFCIFDNRWASDKPNVYIEAGIAYALKKPFILANYHKNRLGVPSDLTHILNIPYTSYEDLCRALYFNLPVFLRKTGLR